MLRGMANNDAFSALRGPAKAAFFEPYARLVQVLYPRARGVIFYDAAGKMVWQKDAEVEGPCRDRSAPWCRRLLTRTRTAAAARNAC